MDDSVRTSGHCHLDIQVLHHQHHMGKMVLGTIVKKLLVCQTVHIDLIQLYSQMILFHPQLDANMCPWMLLEDGTRQLICLFLVLVQAEVLSCWVARLMRIMIWSQPIPYKTHLEFRLDQLGLKMMLQVVLSNYNMLLWTITKCTRIAYCLMIKPVCDDSKHIFGTKGWSSWFCKPAPCVSWTGKQATVRY